MASSIVRFFLFFIFLFLTEWNYPLQANHIFHSIPMFWFTERLAMEQVTPFLCALTSRWTSCRHVYLKIVIISGVWLKLNVRFTLANVKAWYWLMCSCGGEQADTVCEQVCPDFLYFVGWHRSHLCGCDLESIHVPGSNSLLSLLMWIRQVFKWDMRYPSSCVCIWSILRKRFLLVW